MTSNQMPERDSGQSESGRAKNGTVDNLGSISAIDDDERLAIHSGDTHFGPEGTRAQDDVSETKGLFRSNTGRAIVALAGIGVAVAAGIGIGQAGSHEQQGNTATAPAQPVTSQDSSSPEAKPLPDASRSTLNTLEIEAGQTPEALAADFIHTISEWNNAGGEKAKTLFAQTDNATLEGVAKIIATQNRAIYAPIVLGPNYASNPALKKFADEIERANGVTIAAYLATDPASLTNEEHYVRNYKIEKVASQENPATHERTLDISYVGSSNYKKTHFKNEQTDAQDELRQTYSVTFVPNGAVEIAQNIAIR